METLLATFKLSDSAAARLRSSAASGDAFASAILGTGRADVIAIEVLRYEQGWIVLLSAADDVAAPKRLTCVLGFADQPDLCDEARENGFPMIEAAIEITAKTELRVHALVFVRDTAGKATLCSKPAVLVKGIDWTKVAPNERGAWPYEQAGPIYDQPLMSPDADQQANDVRLVASQTARSQRLVQPEVSKHTVSIEFGDAAYPDLGALSNGEVRPDAVWRGTVAALPGDAPAKSPSGAMRIARKSVFGPPAFVFEGVEIIGFRLEQSAFAERAGKLAQLIQPLNPRPVAGNGPTNFEYRLATATVVVELLRYEKMRSREPLRPLLAQDYMCQHELLVRLLVGRVDDDTSQARDAATFVPAIFVDNPWSKIAGREVLGFPKQLAVFSIGGRGPSALPLSMNGKRPDARPDQGAEPLTSVTSISRVGRMQHATPAAPAVHPDSLLEISYSEEFDDRFEGVDLSLLGGIGMLASPWRQQDFQDQVEFRRSFAGSVMADSFRQYGIVQAMPVDHRPLDKALISGRFTLKDVEVQFPAGVASLDLFSPQGSTDPWAQLCAIVGKPDTGPAHVDLPTGQWYRARCAMELKIENTLDW